ncbi:MAG: hypothetical protein K9J12_11945 [Melioribacteraceae bacterium]|nr:hypothetical protein [Melioribacteraceae bacterium]MCF8262889.1 hypothetical protein [Melioribacteraceae bacterium]MCF8430911.1 hypothetical protein [Melioribacteraceae bacterium]
MNSIKIENINLTEDKLRLEFDLKIDSAVHPLYFQSNNVPLKVSNEAFIAIAIIPAMSTRSNILLDGEIDSRFSKALPTIQTIFQQWYPHQQFQKFELSNPIIESRDIETKRNRVGSCFSAGVDSFYTFLKNKEEIDDLVFLNGFERSLDDQVVSEQTSKIIHKIGANFDKNVIEMKSNVRRFLSKFVYSGIHHGAMLAAVGHLLSGSLSKLLIPSSVTYQYLGAWGSHPILDPLWSSNSLEIANDGTDAGRIQKLKFVSESDYALNNMRVCSQNKGTWLNCGECEKCIRTMTGLLGINKLDKCTTFSKKLSVEGLKNTKFKPTIFSYYNEILPELEKNESNYEFCYVISKKIHKPNFPQIFKDVLKNYLRRYKYRFPGLYKKLRTSV